MGHAMKTPETEPHRTVAVLEDDPAIRDDLVGLVAREPCFSLAGQAGSLAEAQWMLAEPPDIVIIDLMLPDGAAFDLISQLSELGRTRIIVISVLGDERAVVSAFRAGAHGYLLKGATGFELREAIYQTLSGNAPISPAIARFLIKEFQGLTPGDLPPPAADIPSLSKREREVLQCLAMGSTDKETARTLGVSPYTVADHLRSVFRKLHVKTRAAAVARAIRTGALCEDESDAPDAPEGDK